VRRRWHCPLWLVTLASLSALGACTDSPAPPPANTETPPSSSAQLPSAAISWPLVSSVLDGTDLVEIQEVSPVPFDTSGIEGQYHSEQGGAELSLSIRRTGDGLEVERRFQEPGAEKLTKAYEFRMTSSEGAASPQQDAFLKKTRMGLLLLEKQSGVESIPASYWTHYTRQP
jgi:hypothetical protein